MGLILKFWGSPSPRGPDHADDSLTAGMDVDVLDRHFLLAFTPMPVQSVEQHRVCARKLVGLVWQDLNLRPPRPERGALATPRS
jgi:hypothetical protein